MRAISVSNLTMFSLAMCFGSSLALASSKGSAAPSRSAAPARSSSAPARAGSSGSGNYSGAGAAGRGPTTTGAHGPTTSNPGGGNQGHGPTTATATRGTTTANAGHAASANTASRPSAGAASHGAIARPASAGSRDAHTASGKDVRTRAGGKVSDVHDSRRGMDVHRGLGGDRRAEVRRADGSRLVSERGHRGFDEHGYRHGGHDFARRTYFFHGRRFDHFYRPYWFHGFAIDVYEPELFYPAPFYGWAYNPWVAPMPYAWGFAAYPWYGYYGPFFAPMPYYPSASAWLADYMVSTSLADAYQAQMDAGLAVQALPHAAPGQTDLTADVQAQIADEVRRQIALENSEAQAAAHGEDPDPQSSGIVRMTSDGVNHVFVVGENMDLTNSYGQECLVSPGDVLQMGAPVSANTASANLVVLASKGGQECSKSSVVAVGLTDLQDLQNYMRQTIDQGLGDLQKRQAKGLPAPPPSASGAPTAAPYLQGAPPSDVNIATEIAQQDQTADSAEREANQEAIGATAALIQPVVPAPAPAAPTVELSRGQTAAQVRGLLGEPKSLVDLGTKQIYVYPDIKITFTSGKVTDVQ
jgi:hypothetical protein